MLTPETATAEVARLAVKLEGRQQDIADRNAYYRGEQSLRFASREWREHHRDRYRGFSDNWCGVVANAPNERLRVTGIRLDDDDPMSELEKQFHADWQRNDMDAQSSAGFLQSIIAARSFVLVWADDEGRPEYTWEQPSQVIVEVDPAHPRRRRLALKLWRDGDIDHATLYTPTELWKFSRPAVRDTGLILPSGFLGGQQWAPREVDFEPWPLPHDLGRVPMVEIPNRPMLGGEPMSDVAGTMAMQDAVNLLWAYLFGGADYASMPARVVMGQAAPKIPILDANGNKVGEQDVPMEELRHGRLLWLTGQSTSIGQWDPAKLDVFTQVIEVAIAHIAAQTRTPAHYLINTGSAANAPAESFTAAETGLVKKCEEFQLFTSPEIREIHVLGALVRGDKSAAELASRGTILWKGAENRSAAQLWDSLQKAKDVGFPFEWIAEQWGLGQEEVSRVLAMRQRELDAGLASAVADALRVQPVG